MSGYTPVFESVFGGTLCGRWPDLPVWLTLLPLADWRGHIDLTPQAIAARTGWPLDLLVQGIAALCQPDPDSRSKDEGGRRLVPIDADRSWGWRVVNIQKYRDKASGSAQVADGRNAEKVRRYKERHRQTPADTTGHLGTPTHTHTSDSDSEEDKTKNNAASAADVVRGTKLPTDPDAILTPHVVEWARIQAPDVDVTKALAEFCDYWRAIPGARGRKTDWPATFRNRLRELQGRARARPMPAATRRAGPQLLPET